MDKIIDEFIIYLTFNCNYSCKMCTQEGLPHPKELSAEEWDKIFADIEKNYPDAYIILIGGEPLLYKDFEKVWQKLSEHKLKKHIVTNGFFLEKYLPVLKTEWFGITLSVDGIGKTHDKIRNQKGAFEKVENALKYMCEYNKKVKENDISFWYTINFVMLPDNIDEIFDFIDLMLKYEPKEIVLNHPRYISQEKNEKMEQIISGLYDTEFLTINKTRQKILFSDEYAKKLNKIIKDVKKRYNPLIVKEFPNFKNESERINYYNENKGYSLRPNKRCLNLYKKPIILPDGTIASCMYNKLGNALEKPISEIWNNETAERKRKHFEED